MDSYEQSIRQHQQPHQCQPQLHPQRQLHLNSQSHLLLITTYSNTTPTIKSPNPADSDNWALGTITADSTYSNTTPNAPSTDSDRWDIPAPIPPTTPSAASTDSDNWAQQHQLHLTQIPTQRTPNTNTPASNSNSKSNSNIRIPKLQINHNQSTIINQRHH